MARSIRLEEEQEDAHVHGYHHKYVDLTMCGVRATNSKVQTENRKDITCPGCRYIIEKGRNIELDQAQAYSAHLIAVAREIETFCREVPLSVKKTSVHELLQLILEKANEQSPETIGIATASAKTSQQREKGKIRKIQRSPQGG